MSIEEKNSLTGAEHAEIGLLVDACNAHDGTEMGVYLGTEFNVHPEMNCFFLCREAGELVGFLCASDDGAEAEVSGCVLPRARRRGIFRALYGRAQAECARFGIEKIILKTLKAFAEGNPFPAAFRAGLDHEEYCMTYRPESTRREPRPMPGFTVRAMERDDIGDAARIAALAFDNPPEVARMYVEGTFASGHMRLYVARSGDEIVGSASVDSTGKGWLIFGLCVDPAHQGKGYGAQLLQETIRLLREVDERPIDLRVDSQNPRALPLYQSCGFEVCAVEQYYRVEK